MDPLTNPTWVIFEMRTYPEPAGGKAVCKQSEWDHMETRQPGRHRLIQAGIESEAEAEKLIRAQVASVSNVEQPAPKVPSVPGPRVLPPLDRPWYRGLEKTQP